MSTPELSLVLPTYNERENLAPLLGRLSAVLRPYAHEIIVVDDDSPDGTGEEAERLRAVHPAVRVVRRQGERGLSSAVIRGFREARGRVVGVMDADLQHDEAVIPALLEAVAEAEFAVASRAAPGGGTGAWAARRKVTSWIAAALARAVLDVPLSDPMSGFFMMPRSLFARLDEGGLRPEGFKVLLYLYVQAVQALGRPNVRVLEVGFTFRERLHGRSKLTPRVMREYVAMLFELRRSAQISWESP
ncbi:MAG TPA: polyprenol monophosphomannose synthase [Gemmatimonadales bacterium]|nr:polyprenol monophosphomannose synthase [Gemmatimonadales bacterium]